MSDDSFTTTTSQSWFSRLGNAITGILFGIVLFLGSFVLLTWNEGRAIKREKTLSAGASQVVSVPSDGPLAENEGKLVHVTGKAEAPDPVVDPVLGISAPDLKLRRDVEIYQWKEDQKSETKKKLGGGEETTTTYTYSKGWSSTLIDSSAFQKPAGHTNPDSAAIESDTFTAEDIHVGKFVLPQSLTDLITNYEPRPVTAEEAKAAAEEHSANIQTAPGGLLYIGKDPANPAIGDIRITFKVAPSGPVSIIARQIEDTFEPFSIPKLGTIELLQTGTVSAETMFQKEQEGNTLLTWILRLVGFVMMLFGLQLVASPLSVLASIIPLLGDIVGAGTGIIALALALPLTLVTIALAWLAYRPLIGIPLLLLAVGSVFLGVKQLLKSRKKAAAAA